MSPIPLEDHRGRRRAGPFWIEEGFAPLLAALLVIAVVAAAYIVAVIQNHP